LHGRRQFLVHRSSTRQAAQQLEEFAGIRITGALVVGVAVIRLASGQYKAIATDSGPNTTTFNVPVAPSTTTNTFQSKRGSVARVRGLLMRRVRPGNVVR
jgi:hypothetical protein